jgi:hypothetical protein
MIVKWMHLFGCSRLYFYTQKVSQLLESLNYEIEDSYKESDKEASAEFFTNKSKTLAFAMTEIFGSDNDVIIPFYGLVIDRKVVRKKFDGDVDSGYSEMRQVNTNPRRHSIQHCEVIYRKHNAVKGVLLVNPPRDYIYRKNVMTLHGIIKAYALRHGLKIYTGGEEMIAETYR